MKIKKGYLLRKSGNKYMIVPTGAASLDFNKIIRINETGAYLWNKLKEGCTEDAIVAEMVATYDGLDEATARRDLKAFMTSISFAIDEE